MSMVRNRRIFESGDSSRIYVSGFSVSSSIIIFSTVSHVNLSLSSRGELELGVVISTVIAGGGGFSGGGDMSRAVRGSFAVS